MPYYYQQYGGGFIPSEGALTDAAKMFGDNLGQRLNPGVRQDIITHMQDWYDPKTGAFMPGWPGRMLNRNYDIVPQNPALSGLAATNLNNVQFVGKNDPQGFIQAFLERLFGGGGTPAAPPVGREGGSASGGGGSPSYLTQGYYENGGPVKQKNPQLASLVDMINMERSQGAVPIMAHNGEFVMNKEATQMLGPQRLDAINQIAQMPQYETGGFVNQTSVSPGGQWLEVPNQGWYYVANQDAAGFMQATGARRRTGAMPPNGANAWDLSGIPASGGLSAPEVQRLINLNPVSNFIIPSQETPTTFAATEKNLPVPPVPGPGNGNGMYQDAGVLAQGNAMNEQQALEAAAGRRAMPAPAAPIYSTPVGNQATQIVPPTGGAGVPQAPTPPSPQTFNTTNLSAGPAAIANPPADIPDIAGVGTAQPSYPPMVQPTPTPQVTPPPEVSSMQAPGTPFRQRHQSLGLDMNYLQNASPEEAMAYLYSVSQNRETPQLTWSERKAGASDPLMPYNDQLFSQMMQQYLGVKGVGPSIEQANLQNQLTEAQVRQANTEASVGENTQAAKERYINAQAVAQELENNWNTQTEEGRMQLFRYSLDQAATDNENYARLKDLEMGNLDAQTQYYLAQAAALSTKGNSLTLFSPGDYADMYKQGMDMYNTQVDNVQNLMNSLENVMNGESWGKLSRDQQDGVQAEYYKNSVIMSWLQDPQIMERSTIDEYIMQLNQRYWPANVGGTGNSAGNKAGELDEQLRKQFGFDQTSFSRMKDMVRNASQLRNFPQNVFGAFGVQVPGMGTSTPAASAGASGGLDSNAIIELIRSIAAGG